MAIATAGWKGTLIFIAAAAVEALVLYLGWKLRAIGIGSGTVERDQHPGLYWAGMALAATGFVVCTALAMSGK